MPNSVGTIIAPIISGAFAYVIARRKSATELRQLRDAQVQHNIIEGDFKSIIGWLGDVGEIATASSMEKLITYKIDLSLMPSLLLLDARYCRNWVIPVEAIEASIRSHRSSNTLLDDTIVLKFRELRREIMWFYERQRKHLRAGKVRIIMWRIQASILLWKQKRTLVN